jgi:hypothetical protein
MTCLALLKKANIADHNQLMQPVIRALHMAVTVNCDCSNLYTHNHSWRALLDRSDNCSLRKSGILEG